MDDEKADVISWSDKQLGHTTFCNARNKPSSLQTTKEQYLSHVLDIFIILVQLRDMRSEAW